MKHDKTEPCMQCPFRTASAPGWLGSYTPQTAVQAIQREYPFPCHMTVDYTNPNWRDTIFAEGTKVQACAGFLILMRKMAKIPRDPELLDHCQRLDPNHPDVFKSHFNFLAYHSGPHRRRMTDD